ncbi:MAG: ATP-dependent helicase [Candidatus Pacebacteria bacterium]|nr:ATP-dependent helicase [Candidatus Paceibacterota bacterium]
MKANSLFQEAYKDLNRAQKEAVESIDGPVMVIAGPGTGKTQVLALRIAHILTETDTPASGILCLTFTNAGVHAMRERLLRLMGSRGSEVVVSTFHRFGIGLIEKYYTTLGFPEAPVLLSDTEAITLVDEILESGEWQYIRPRGDSARYFSDLKSLISLLKREGISPEDFLVEVDKEIKNLANDPESISTRGERKGELKREVETKIEALRRTREVVKFYEVYESLKLERALMDYDDVLKYAVQLAEDSDEVKAHMRENFLYVLVDEHQDSSGVQNAFLEAVWGETERPNIFVVGDDRQLIYGFGGASIEHFTKFRETFGKIKEITLIENYRSTQTILDAAEALLQSSLAKGKLESTSKADEEKLMLLECDYPRDEILSAGKEILEKIKKGTAPEDIAILVPKNYQVRSAVLTLRDMGIPVAASGTVSFFAQPEALTIRRILSTLADPYDGSALGELMLDRVIGIPPLVAHQFLRTNLRKVNLETLMEYAGSRLPTDPIARLGGLLRDWLECSQTLGLHGLVQKIGEDLFFTQPKEHEALLREIEVIRTYLHLLESGMQKDAHLSLSKFVEEIDRLEQYGHEIPLAVFSGKNGVRVLTLHGSKGLEFESVYIAHLDESSLMKGKRMGFALPEKVQALIEEKNELAARRELYVAITRAKKYCTLSFSRHTYTGGDMVEARILADLPEKLIERKALSETEAELLKDPKLVVGRVPQKGKTTFAELSEVVKEEYSKTNVSVTLLNNFFECPWKWYFRNLLQLPELKTESLLLGSLVHTGIEYFLKNRDTESTAGLEVVLQKRLDKESITSEAFIKRVMREAKKILADFHENYLPNIGDDAQSERPVAYRDPKFPHLSFYGMIDMTERSDDRMVSVTDFKTGSGKAKSAVEKLDEEGRLSGYKRQLAMYSFLIENAEKGTEVISSKLLFVEEKVGSKDSVYMTKITGEDIDLLKTDIADYDALLQNGEWVNRPCYAKSYGKNTECEHCAKAKMLYGSAP